MAYLTSFEKKLDQLFQNRTYSLRSRLGLKKRGSKPQMTREKINESIEELQNLASNILAKGLAKKEFEENAMHKKGRKVIGWGWKKQKKLFEEWFQKNYANQREVIYVFWNKNKCLYVGRTGNGGCRPSSHFSEKWCRATRVDIYPSNSKSQLPKLECLAVHRFEPSENNYKPSDKKWTKKCPLCAVHKQIEGDLRKIFKIK